MSKERPILFSAPMVRAILDGRKTVTRRPVKLRGAEVIEERDDKAPRNGHSPSRRAARKRGFKRN